MSSYVSHARQLAAATLVCIGTPALAIPSAYVSRFGSLPIENSTNSTLLRDTEASQTVWVLPPNAGKTEFKGLVPSANLGFCPGLKDLMRSSNDIDRRLGQLYRQHETLIPELTEAERALTAARAELGTVAEMPELQEIIRADTHLKELERRNEELLKSLETCNESCEAIQAELERITAAADEEREHLRQLEDERHDANRAYRLAQARVDQAEAALDGIGSRFKRLADRLNELSRQVFDMYQTKGRLEGGIAQIDYDTGWDQNVQRLELDYPAFDFRAIPTANVRVHARIVGAGSEQSYYESLPMILDYSIDGVPYLPWGQVDHTMTALPSQLTGNMRLSTLGACPIIDHDFFNGTGMTPEFGDLSTPKFAISATYDYPVAFKFRVTASYNLWKFYEVIKEEGSSGGFFSSHSWSRTAETKLGGDAFKIDWLIEDPSNALDFEARTKIATQLKSDLMARVLTMVAQPIGTGVGPQGLTAPAVPPEPGSMVLARGLSETCGWNIYCQAGSWVLRGLQAIFGSSGSEQSFRERWDYTATDTWSSEVASYRPAATSFARN